MTMDIIDKRIYSCNEAICKNIESLQANERGLLSQNILSQLRNFLECVFFEDLCGFRQFSFENVEYIKSLLTAEIYNYCLQEYMCRLINENVSEQEQLSL